jgi:hypothetical protein
MPFGSARGALRLRKAELRSRSEQKAGDDRMLSRQNGLTQTDYCPTANSRGARSARGASGKPIGGRRSEIGATPARAAGAHLPVQVKSVDSDRLRLLLTHRRTLKRKLLDIENEVRRTHPTRFARSKTSARVSD